MENGRRMPPNSMEAEQSVLGSMLLDQDAVAAAMETLTEEDFYAPAHQVIFSAMAQLYRSAQPIDLVTLVDVLEQRNEVTKAGGMEYIAQLSRTVPTTTNIGRYVAIVEDRSALRSIIKAGSEMVDEGFRADKPSGEVISAAHDAIYSIITRQRTDSLRPIMEALGEAFERINEAALSKGGIVGTPTGYVDLDAMTAGFNKDQLIILAARPGVGKTSFALNIAQNIAMGQSLPVAIFSLEMSAGDLAMRMMCSEAEIPLMQGPQRPGQGRRVCEAVKRHEHPFHRSHLYRRQRRRHRAGDPCQVHAALCPAEAGAYHHRLSPAYVLRPGWTRGQPSAGNLGIDPGP